MDARAERIEWWRTQSDPADWRVERSADAGQWDPPLSAVPFWSAIVFTAVLLFSPQAYVPALEAVRPAMIPAAIGLGMYVLDRFNRRAPLFMRTPTLRMAGLLAAWATLTAPFSIWPGGSFAFLFGMYFKTLAIFWLLSHTATTLPRLRQVAWSLSIMAVGLGLIAMNNYMSGVFIDQAANSDRVVGNEGALTKNPNDMALMINIIIPLTMALLLSTSQPKLRFILLCMLGSEVMTVVLTFSRAGFLTLGCIMMLYLWKLRRRSERVWIYGLLVVFLLAVPFLPTTYFDRMSTIVHTEADSTGSAGERWTDMVIAAGHVLSSPVVGSGVGMNVLAMNEARGGAWRPVHNVVLELAIELGMIGAILFVLLVVSALKSTVDVQRRLAGEPGLKPLTHLTDGIQISLIAFALASMFHPVSYHPYFYYVAALAIAAEAISRSMRASCQT